MIVYTQDRQKFKEDWAIESLDIVLGLVGGFTGLLWAALATLLGGYSTFKLENSLIGAVYPTSPIDDGDEGERDTLSSENEARRSMMSVVAERGKYFYDYSEYMMALILRFFCCCACCLKSAWHKRRISKLERHEIASERLSNETDIVKLLYL